MRLELAVGDGVEAKGGQEGKKVTRDEAEAIAARARPGWRVTKLTEVDDESGPSFEIQIEQGTDRRTLLVAANEEVVGERE